MAAGDINDPLSDIPGITLRDDTDAPGDQGAGFALMKFRSGALAWLPNGGTTRYSIDTSSASQLAALTAEGSPADADLLLLEKASDGTKRKVRFDDLPGASGIAGVFDAYLLYVDEKAQATDGGTFTSGSWQTRDLTTEKCDTANIGSLSGNAVTLPAGTYRCDIRAPAYHVTEHKARLYNVTGAASLVEGGPMPAYASDNGASHSFVVGVFTLGVESAVRVEHYCTVTCATYGLGVALGQGAEVYTVAEFWRFS